ncbi:MAG: UDP-N-acetylmuramoyl-L-alanyl-D-glutamate--2,6-diaminopimelate ligase, partial [Cellvibrionaceae bacterium]
MTQQHTTMGKSLASLLANKWLPSDVGDVAVSGMCLDHRQLAPGDMFVAVAGTRNDGRRFVNDAIAAGAAAVLKTAEQDDEKILWRGAVPVIPCVSLEQDVSAIAGRFYASPSHALNVVGVTGTNGKSTCTHLLAQLYSALGKSAAVVGTLGYGMVARAPSVTKGLIATGLTTADPIANQRILAELRDSGADTVAMEVSSHSLEQYRVAGITFDAALFTNLTHDHLDYHGDMAQYGLAKKKLLVHPGLRYRVINLDDSYGRQLVVEFARSREKTKTLTYSLSDKGADLYLENVEHLTTGVRARINTPWGAGSLSSVLLGDFNLSNLLGVIAISCAQGKDLTAVLQVVATLQPVAGR